MTPTAFHSDQLGERNEVGEGEGFGHSPRWVRIFSMTSLWSMKAMMRIAPPHRVHNSGSASYTFLINSA